MLVIGDVHGRLDLLTKLLAVADTSNGVCFVGDLIDRGPHSREVVELVRSSGYLCVRGNHEQFMVDKVLRGLSYGWDKNGGINTLLSYGVGVGNFRTHPQIIDDAKWMESLPVYLELPDQLVVSHSACLPYWDARDSSDDAILWGRDFRDTPDLPFYNIFGHTPVYSPVLSSTYAIIDTMAFKSGVLTGMYYPSKEIIQVS